MFFYFASKTIFSADANGDPIVSEIPTPEFPQGDYGAALVKMFLTLIVLVALLALTFWFLRRLIQSRLRKGIGKQSITILEKKMLSPKSMLYLIEADGQKILIAESNIEIRRIHSWEEPSSVEGTQDFGKNNS